MWNQVHALRAVWREHNGASQCAHVPGVGQGGLGVDVIDAQCPAASASLRVACAAHAAFRAAAEGEGAAGWGPHQHLVFIRAPPGP